MKVLIVDDDFPTRQLIRKILKIEAGYDVIEATNGKEAIELINTEHPDVVVMDIIMPVMDGEEALKLLRFNPQTHEIPIVMISGMKDTETFCKMRFENGANWFVGKPFDSKEIITAVNDVYVKTQMLKKAG